jgi:hypothetical protein
MTKRAILDMGLASIEKVLNRIQTYLGRGDKPILKEKRLCGNDGIVETVEKSSDFPTLPTMPWKSLRLSHIPTKSAVTSLDRFLKSKSKNPAPSRGEASRF